MMRYRAKVIGVLWEGRVGATVVAFEAEPTASPQVLQALVNKRAGDFQTVLDAEVEALEWCMVCGVYHWEVRLSWVHDEHEVEFAEMMYGEGVAWQRT